MSIQSWVDKENDEYTYNRILFSLRKKRRKDRNTVTYYNMDFEDIMLSERSQLQKDRYCMNPLVWGIQSSQIDRQKVERWLPGAWRGGEGVVI